MPTKKLTSRSILERNPELNFLDHMDLPPEAWKGLFCVTLHRLEKVSPVWAQITLDEFMDFEATWTSNAYWDRYNGGNVGEQWMVEAFRHMMKQTLKKGPKDKNVHPRFKLYRYIEFLRAIQEIKKGNPDIEQSPLKQRERFWRNELQGLLNKLPYSERKQRFQVTDSMISKACSESPSQVALEIIKKIYFAGPVSVTKKVFPKLRKTDLSPLELWQKGIWHPAN